MMKQLRDGVVRWKFRIGYITGFVTTFAAIVIITSTIQDKLFILGKGVPFIYLLCVVIVCVLMGAYLMDKFGFIESEIEYSNTKNRVLREIHGGKDGRNNKDW